MKPIKLRAHHGMCLAYFEGKGYSQGFTAHMQTVLDGMKDDPLLEIVSEGDIVCSQCPNLVNGICNTPELVLKYDAQVLARCGLEPHTSLHWSEFSQLVSRNILSCGKRQEICGSCEWTTICKSRESSPNF